jgi:hypothetical protein
MKALADIAGAVRDCVVAAWIDARTGDVIERHDPPRAHADELVAPALDVAAEIMRSRERPSRMVLLSPHHVHIVQRMAGEAHRVLVVICERTPNIGLAVAHVRAFADAFVEAA